MRPAVAISLVVLLTACKKDDDNPASSPTDPTTDWSEGDADTDADTDSDTDADSDTDLEIIGTYTDDWGGTHVIDMKSWVQTYAAADTGSKDSVSAFAISTYDNDNDYLVAQNDAANEYYAELWSRFDWVYKDGDLFYCQIAYDAKDAATAEAVDTADPTFPADGGCNKSPWTELTIVEVEDTGADTGDTGR